MKDPAIRKLYYSISEVSKITDLEQYVLRYWETEFEKLSPSKNRAGNRIYTNKDIALIQYIKKLLREERYTIEGAKQVLDAWNPNEPLPQLEEAQPAPDQQRSVEPEQTQLPLVIEPPIPTAEVKKTLREVKNLLMLLQEKLETNFT